jgi:L-fuconolactonase
MRELASHANVYCKLSGLMTELREPGAERLIPLYVAELLDAFGSERLIWGSDWPVMTLASSYAEWLALSERCLAGLHQDARERVLGANAVRFYGLDRT